MFQFVAVTMYCIVPAWLGNSMAFIIPRDTATFSAPETASFDVDEAGVISDEAPEEGSEEEPSTFKIDMFLTGGKNVKVGNMGR